MFCPKCKAEYRQGFYKCADCGVDLVCELLKEKKIVPKVGKFVILFISLNRGEIALLTSILETTDIPYYFNEEAAQNRVQSSLMIEETRLKEAKELLKDFCKKMK